MVTLMYANNSRLALSFRLFNDLICHYIQQRCVVQRGNLRSVLFMKQMGTCGYNVACK
jgi:hypothetical protein